jgi:Domain of unknown function (DUF4844)
MKKEQMIENLNKLLSVKKFEVDESQFYPGIEDNEIKEKLTKCINESIENFISIVNGNYDNDIFLNAIKNGLDSFDQSGYYDTEEREQICRYFEKIMDAIGMESSNGLLNTWMYGFDV